ncbi:hypothetical protein [Paenibacillus dendritiformis]
MVIYTRRLKMAGGRPAETYRQHAGMVADIRHEANLQEGPLHILFFEN